jgi:reverse transcriptase-like protein
LKEHLHSLTTLARPITGETLYLYISLTQHTVSAVLIREENTIRYPVYFVSKMLLDAETRYSMIEKVAFAIIVAARKLRPYFDVHTVVVLTYLPLEKSLTKIERFGRLAKWAVELNGLGIQFEPRRAIKGQALADIFAEWVTKDESEEPIWQLLTDGSSRLVGAGAGLVLITLEGKVIEYALKF